MVCQPFWTRVKWEWNWRMRGNDRDTSTTRDLENVKDNSNDKSEELHLLNADK